VSNPDRKEQAMTDTRTYFFTPEADGRVRLYIVTSSGTVHNNGVYRTRESAVARKRLEDATEIPAPETFTVYKAPQAPLLRVFAEAVAR
jgi:hypothetical protein